jgi:hypothetical protein
MNVPAGKEMPHEVSPIHPATVPLVSCGSSTKRQVEAVDLKPVGNAVEFFGICMVAAVIVIALTAIILAARERKMTDERRTIT